MPTILGVDWSTEMAALLGAELYAGSFTKAGAISFDAGDPANVDPSDDAETYTFQGAAFSYAVADIDGELIRQGDYRVMVLLGSILDEDDELASGIIPGPGDSISIAPPGQSDAIAGVVVSVTVNQAQCTCSVRGLGL